jgi:predicted Zn-dependent protease
MTRNLLSSALTQLFTLALVSALAGAMAGCAKPPAPEASCNFVQNGDLQRVSWGGSTPVVMHIDSSVPSDYYDAINAAAKTWNDAVQREVIKIGAVINTNSNPKQDGANVIYLLNTWEAERSNEQARTTVYWAGNRVFEADVRLNAHDFSFFSGTTTQAGKVDMQSLLVHEFGHVLGLVHTATPQSVMVRSLPSATKRRALSVEDLKSVRCEY